MDELGFYVPSTVFQSFRDDGRMNMKGSVQWSAVLVREESRLQRDSNPRPRELGRTGVDNWREPTTWFRIGGKELCFHKIIPIMMPKIIGYKIFVRYFWCACVRDKMTKTGTTDLMKCASKINFRTRRVRCTSCRQVLDHSRPKGNLLTVYTMFLEKYPFVYLRNQAIFNEE